MNRDAMLLVDALRDPHSTRALDANGWTALIAMARAEQLIGTLAHRLAAEPVAAKVAEILEDARTNAEYQRRYRGTNGVPSTQRNDRDSDEAATR